MESKIDLLLEEITSESKWYMISENEKEQVRLRVTAHRIRKGEARPSTIKKFFRLFGFNIVIENRLIIQ
ncbi:hypothetical protein OHD16_06665 [Sphingobacterium sp. ML3W]|uniref:hypothetical protein n=1 Tax=Sphingobacterium sp. ML3W TaxID=1538644 RepID=UPI002499C5A2|nr:hypothetical protein [Sphingobacterium sp. ML3W]WFA79651.1 hypothetical protein OGI71_26905 [Sphingobacterium sp. ML3W]